MTTSGIKRRKWMQCKPYITHQQQKQTPIEEYCDTGLTARRLQAGPVKQARVAPRAGRHKAPGMIAARLFLWRFYMLQYFAEIKTQNVTTRVKSKKDSTCQTVCQEDWKVADEYQGSFENGRAWRRKIVLAEICNPLLKKNINLASEGTVCSVLDCANRQQAQQLAWQVNQHIGFREKPKSENAHILQCKSLVTVITPN